jgi:hypothetical protein
VTNDGKVVNVEIIKRALELRSIIAKLTKLYRAPTETFYREAYNSGFFDREQIL